MIETHLAHHHALIAIVVISTDFPNHIVRKLSYESTSRWSFDHHPRVFASTPCSVRAYAREFFAPPAAMRHQFPRYKSMKQRDRSSLSRDKRSCGLMGVGYRDSLLPLFLHAHQINVILSLTSIKPTARMRVYGAPFLSARGVCLR